MMIRRRKDDWTCAASVVDRRRRTSDRVGRRGTQVHTGGVTRHGRNRFAGALRNPFDGPSTSRDDLVIVHPIDEPLRKPNTDH